MLAAVATARRTVFIKRLFLTTSVVYCSEAAGLLIFRCFKVELSAARYLSASGKLPCIRTTRNRVEEGRRLVQEFEKQRPLKDRKEDIDRLVEFWAMSTEARKFRDRHNNRETAPDPEQEGHTK